MLLVYRKGVRERAPKFLIEMVDTMARLPKAEEIKRHHAVRTMVEDGYDHNEIGKKLGMRPQNVLAMMRSMNAKEDGDIVTPAQQGKTLRDVTDRILDDLYDLDAIIKEHNTARIPNSTKLLKLYKLKKEYYDVLVNMWAVPQSIVSSRTGISTISGDKVQVNLAKIDYRKLDEVAAEAANILDKARLDGELAAED